MGYDYFIFYTEASIICIVILSMLLINDRSGTHQEKQLWFNRAVIAFILYFISDACWAAMLSGLFTKVRFYTVLVNLSNFVLMHLMAYGLFVFIAVSEKMPFRKSLFKVHLSIVPLCLSLISFMVAYFSNPYYWIDANNDLNPLYFPFMFIVPGSYMLAAFVLSIRNAIDTPNKEDKMQFLLIGSLPLGVIAFGLLQVVLLNAPTLCFGSTIMWLWYYIKNMQAMVSIDELTNLNNRRQINRFMKQLHYTKDSHTYIMMMDINRFKKINDTYGHAEGDRALVIVSDALRETCNKIGASVFLGRYGGDEFTVVIQDPAEDETAEHICDLFRKAVSAKTDEYDLSYRLEISIGCDELKDADDSALDCLKRADKNLYIDKKC